MTGVYKEVRWEDRMAERVCSICFAECGEGTSASVELSCGHPYHRKCIRRWLGTGRDSTCPTCRTPTSLPALVKEGDPPELIGEVVRDVIRMAYKAIRKASKSAQYVEDAIRAVDNVSRSIWTRRTKVKTGARLENFDRLRISVSDEFNEASAKFQVRSDVLYKAMQLLLSFTYVVSDDREEMEDLRLDYDAVMRWCHELTDTMADVDSGISYCTNSLEWLNGLIAGFREGLDAAK